MVELEKSGNGFLKSFKMVVAQKALLDGKRQKENGQNYWKLPEDSIYKADKQGILVLKKKKKLED
jgi:hypothetical protein